MISKKTLVVSILASFIVAGYGGGVSASAFEDQSMIADYLKDSKKVKASYGKWIEIV